MLYAKICNLHHIKFKNPKPLDQCTFDHDDVFYHHFYHDLQSGVKLYNCVEERHWEHIRNNKNVKILHENCGETFNYSFANDIKSTIDMHNIDPKQIYVLVMDEVHKDFLIERLLELGITEVNIGIYNFLLNKVNVADRVDSTTTKQFSMLSRNYRSWRLQLYVDLLQKGLLDKFVYSFYNIHPYNKTVFSDKTIIDDLLDAGVNVDSNTLRWISSIPFTLEKTDNVYDKWGDATYQAIFSADFHVVVETHFDLFYYVPTNDSIYSRNLAPSSITEKTYKPIVCCKPFLMFGTPFFLEDIRKLGYKTFSPYIDETYDTITDNKDRLKALVAEIERISNLSPNKYLEVVNGCKNIAVENLKIFRTKKQNTTRNHNFDFIDSILIPHAYPNIQIL